MGVYCCWLSLAYYIYLFVSFIFLFKIREFQYNYYYCKFRILIVGWFKSEFWQKKIRHPDVYARYLICTRVFVKHYRINCFETLLNVLSFIEKRIAFCLIIRLCNRVLSVVQHSAHDYVNCKVRKYLEL